MANRMYNISVSSLSGLTTTVPFVQIATPATVSVRLKKFEIYQESSVTSTQFAISLTTRSTASTLPTAYTPVALSSQDPASKLTGSTTTCATGIATVTGTLTNTIWKVGFNVQNGFMDLPIPDLQITLGPSLFITAQFVNAPSAFTWDAQLYFEELG